MAARTIGFDGGGFFAFLRPRRAGEMRATAATRRGMPASREVSKRRAEAMRGFFPKVTAWMAKQSYLAEMSSVDRYLSQASDLFDLERRIRDVERRDTTARWF